MHFLFLHKKLPGLHNGQYTSLKKKAILSYKASLQAVALGQESTTALSVLLPCAERRVGSEVGPKCKKVARSQTNVGK
ncbi:hypothetical protein CHARACLAT_019160 [Characodon lateralis]|uniref:Uncharacterized protein n=1 Tax=Characodon lateralis TaxID=208331 RepID=A0ABU7CPN0_9TELE|nr:hypothetical protein [Characodon lateralis]